MNVLQPIGRFFLAFLATAGRLALFAGRGVSHCARPPFYPRMVLRQMVEIGYFSLPVVGLKALFAGMVLALQSYTGFARFSAEGDIDASGNPHVDQFINGRAEGPIKMAVRA